MSKGGAWECPRVGVFFNFSEGGWRHAANVQGSIFRRADDVTRTMSKGGGCLWMSSPPPLSGNPVSAPASPGPASGYNKLSRHRFLLISLLKVYWISVNYATYYNLSNHTPSEPHDSCSLLNVHRDLKRRKMIREPVAVLGIIFSMTPYSGTSSVTKTALWNSLRPSSISALCSGSSSSRLSETGSGGRKCSSSVRFSWLSLALPWPSPQTLPAFAFSKDWPGRLPL